jgi:hypothetical protein
MDYRYIEQLLERYWQCETSIEEERILKAFFSQDEVPQKLAQYRDLFAYQAMQTEECQLGDDFDQKILAMTGQDEPVRARVVSIGERLKPLFKAAAVIAMILTLGNAIQAPNNATTPVIAEDNGIDDGPSMAKTDSVKTDSMKQAAVTTTVIE